MSDEYIQDGGHGGEDPGACSKGNIEKVYTLEAATYVDKRLAEHGIKSDMTRSGDVTLDETPRTSKVKKSGAKRCLSHHYNAGGGEGMELIHSIYSDGKFEKLIAEEFKKAGYPLRPNTIFSKKGKSGRDYYYMHRETGSVSTTIIEYEFVDGDNGEKIKSKEYRQGMYECVVRAVCRQEKVAYKPLSQPKPPIKKPVTPIKHGNKVLHRVIVNGEQIGAYDIVSNISKQVENAIKSGAKEIKIEKV
jgi:N-acetylmuramoyl-L-alanine amidase